MATRLWADRDERDGYTVNVTLHDGAETVWEGSVRELLADNAELDFDTAEQLMELEPGWCYTMNMGAGGLWNVTATSAEEIPGWFADPDVARRDSCSYADNC